MVLDAFERIDAILRGEDDVAFECQQTAIVVTQLPIILDDKNGRARAPA